MPVLDQVLSITIEKWNIRLNTEKHSDWEIKKLYSEDEDSDGTENSTDMCTML